MNHKVINYINKNQLINENDKILVAVSGGSDSMALLNFLISNRDYFKIKDIVVCHINHLLRGKDAYNDQMLVEEFCRQNNIHCKSFSVNIKEIVKKTKESFELIAREERYKIFNSFTGYKIVTAHNMNDNVETFFFNAIRGSSLKGLCSIPIKRDNIIRPLLCVTKQEINTYCKDNNVPFCIDKTNFENNYTRNKIRNIILPLFCNINNNYVKSIDRLINNLNVDNHYLEKLALQHYNKIYCDKGLDISQFDGEDKAIYIRCIILFLQQNGFSIDNKLILKIFSLIEKKKGKINIKNNIYIVVYNGFLYTYEDRHIEYSIDINEGEYHLYDDLFCKINIFSKSKYEKMQKKLFHCCLDYDRIKKGTVIRNKRVKDYVFLNKRNVTKTLKKFFIEEKISVKERTTMPLIAFENKIINVPFYMIDYDYVVTKNTKKVLCIQYRRK